MGQRLYVIIYQILPENKNIMHNKKLRIIFFGGIDNLQRGLRRGELMGQGMHMKHYMSSLRPEKSFTAINYISDIIYSQF